MAAEDRERLRALTAREIERTFGPARSEAALCRAAADYLGVHADTVRQVLRENVGKVDPTIIKLCCEKRGDDPLPVYAEWLGGRS